MAKIGNTALKALLDGSPIAQVHQQVFGDALDSFADELEARTVTATANAEVANVIKVDLQLVEDDGATVIASTGKWLATIPGRASTAFHLAETGTGAEISPTAQAQLLFSLDASGVAQLAVTDVSGASGATVDVVLQPADHLGTPVCVQVTFD